MQNKNSSISFFGIYCMTFYHMCFLYITISVNTTKLLMTHVVCFYVMMNLGELENGAQ